MATSKVKGHVSPGYEPVKDHLQKMLDSGCEDKLQLCVYVGKKCVVDLSASFNPDDQSYSADTMQCVFSSGKTVASIIVAKLVEQGLMNYGDKIVTHWPKFASPDHPEKSELTVADVLRHESGLSWIDHTFQKEDFLLENIKKNKVSDVLEKEPLHFPGFGGDAKTPTKREYHTITRGIVLNEIVRRVDPKGRTIGEIVKEDPNFDNIRIGLADDDIKKCTNEVALSSKKVLMQSMTPKHFGRGIEPNFLDLATLVQKGKKSAPKFAHRPTFMEGIPRELSRAHEVVNEEFLRKSELPSANVHASARSLAKLAAMMANFGESLDGNDANCLMTHDTWLKMHDKEKRAFDAMMSSKNITKIILKNQRKSTCQSI